MKAYNTDTNNLFEFNIPDDLFRTRIQKGVQVSWLYLRNFCTFCVDKIPDDTLNITLLNTKSLVPINKKNLAEKILIL